MTLKEKEHNACLIRYQVPDGEQTTPGPGEAQWIAGYRAALKDVAVLAERDTMESPNLHIMILGWLKELGEE